MQSYNLSQNAKPRNTNGHFILPDFKWKTYQHEFNNYNQYNSNRIKKMLI